MHSIRSQNVSVSSLVPSICSIRVATSSSEFKSKGVPELLLEGTNRLHVQTQIPELRLYCQDSHAMSTGIDDVFGNVRMYWSVSVCVNVYGWT